LAGRRLWHRFRGQPDRADLDRPDPIEVAMAYGDDDVARRQERAGARPRPAGPVTGGRDE
ncbi:MAG: hypothetical protein U1D00_11005, partial [Mycobacterium sp.]|nr:hypothetical protein [Mycobacterium sp.]